MAALNDHDEQPLWQVWATRILVTAALAFALEYLGRQPVPERINENETNEDPPAPVMEFSALQYGDLPTAKDSANQQSDQQQSDNMSDNIAELEGESDKESVDLNEKKETDRKGGSLKTNIESTKEENEDGKEADSQEHPNSEESEDNNAATVAAATTTNASDPATPATATVASEPQEINFKNKSSDHPGLDGFHRWYDIEASLYRQYQVGRTDGGEVHPNYVPHSRRGSVKLHLRVTNEMSHRPEGIDVYWINYKGGEDHKGRISRGDTWHQTTWIEHPWVFRLSDTQELLLHYFPERIIQHLDEAPTSDENDPTIGVQRFTIRAPSPAAIKDNHICSIDDPILPHPASHYFMNANDAHTWTLLHMKRQEYFAYHPGAQLLNKYLTNIVMNPNNASYRKIRIANPKFYQAIWQTAARGLLLAAGFVEQHAYAELGTAAPLPGSRVQDISTVLFRLEQTRQSLEGDEALQESNSRQPEGADGRGRAGFGLAGERNPRS